MRKNEISKVWVADTDRKRRWHLWAQFSRPSDAIHFADQLRTTYKWAVHIQDPSYPSPNLSAKERAAFDYADSRRMGHSEDVPEY